MKREVSVVIPVYNGEKYIKESINSALNQTFDDLEIIVVNDASTDRTEDVIFENFSDLIGDKLKYIKNEKNMERVYSRNIGVEKAEGEFIFFLDYDDLWERDYIEETLKFSFNADIVYSFPRKFLIDDKGKIRISKKNIGSLEEVIFSGLVGYPSATMFKKSKFLKYDEKFLYREDWEIFIRAYLNNYNIKILDNEKVIIREHTNRTSRDKRFLYATLKVFEEYVNDIPKMALPYFYFHVGETCMRFGELKLGWKLIVLAIKENPKILKDKRRVLSILKRGIRIDRQLKI
jgi:glycosyltransferase involved in cell wall biosynthesis